jgi:hypothetical protein
MYKSALPLIERGFPKSDYICIEPAVDTASGLVFDFSGKTHA